MSTTTTASPPNILRGKQSPGELYVLEIPVYVDGTYATATKPNFNILTSLRNAKQGITAVDVKKVVAFRDYYDGTNRYTASNAVIALTTVNSGSVNDKVTFTVESGETNGDTGTEISDSTSLAGYFTFLVVCEITGGTM